MGEGGRKVEMAGAEDTASEDDADVDGALVTVGAEDVESVGADLAGGVLEPSEKKSTTGAAGLRGWEDAEAGILERPSLSRDMFALPFLREGGTNDVDGPDTSVGPSTSASPSTEGLSALAKPVVSCCRASLLEVRNTNPGPPPPPSTRSSFFSITGTACFGAGSILRREDFPAPVPDATRGFFAGGASSSSSSGGGREGRLTAIFLVRLGLGGAALPPVFVVTLELEGKGREREEEDFGGGRANVDLEAGGGSFGRSDDADVVEGDVVAFKFSSPLSTSLP